MQQGLVLVFEKGHSESLAQTCYFRCFFMILNKEEIKRSTHVTLPELLGWDVPSSFRNQLQDAIRLPSSVVPISKWWVKPKQLGDA